MHYNNIKIELLQACMAKLGKQIDELEMNLANVEEARNNETKSSVGDKYETGRSMMQLEYQKLTVQHRRLLAQLAELKVINTKHVFNKADKGSLIDTDQGIYFICTALGKIKMKEQVYFCISVQSPIGKLLLNKIVGESILFNGRRILIKEIA